MSSTKASVLRMSETTTLTFLGLYERESCLWNPGEGGYKNRDERAAAAMRIADELGIAGFGKEHVLQKFKNLRSSYCQEIKKIRESLRSGCSVEEAYAPSVVWFAKMDSFIRPHVQHREMLGGARPVWVHNDYNDLDMDRKTNGLESPSATADLPPRPPLLATKRLKVESTRDLARQSDVLPACTFLSTDRDDDDDEYFYISKAWSAKLKRLAPDQQMFAEKAINDVLFEAGLGTLHKYSVQINEILPVNINHLSTLLKDGTTVSDANNMDSKC